MPYQPIFRHVLTWEIAAASAVFAVVMAILITALIRRRAGADRPLGKHERPMLEGSYTVALIGIATAIAWNSIAANNQEHSTPRPAMRVAVVSFQWCWKFDYSGMHRSVAGTCGPHGTVPTLVVPTGRPVELDVTTTDVVHEFWIPGLYYKVEALPNHVNRFTITLDHPGTWAGKCSEFCGLYHTYMRFVLRAVSPGTFRSWMDGAATLR